MGDNFNIDKIDTFITEMPELELSDITKIIKQMINIKNSGINLNVKKTKAYSIVDKIEKNNISKNLGAKIKKYHIDSYDVVDEAINNLADLECCIRDDLFDYYWDIYVDVLISLDVDIDNCNAIKDKATEIYSTIVCNINKELYSGKKSDIPTNRRITYIGAITSYVFYKCKFLIPIEPIN